MKTMGTRIAKNENYLVYIINILGKLGINRGNKHYLTSDRMELNMHKKTISQALLYP